MIIKKAALYLIIFFLATSSFAQGKFRIIDSREESEKVNFSLVNNLIIVKAKINGKELSFLLDTGIKKTMLFNLVYSDSLILNNTEMIQLNGLGEGEPIQAIKSKGNLFEMKGIINPDMSLFVIVDDLFDLSAKLGVDIHGIIGGDLFEDFVVKINYASERLTFFNPDSYDAAKCKSCESFPLEFYSNKPFINVGIENHLGKEFTARLLIDSGGGDSLWLFPYSHPDIVVSDNSFDDFLGRGLNGNIFGKKSKIKKIKIGSFEFENASVSYPDSTSMLKMHSNKDRNGTLGAGILKRFIVIMDYPNREITLKKNNKLFREPFLYNKSGIELSYGRDMLVQEKKPRMVQSEDSNTSITQIFFNYGLTYKPSFQIVLIRKGSPAHYAGLMEGDILLEINGVPAFSLEMTEVIHIFSQKDNKKIRVLVDRNGEHLRYTFNLKSLLD